MPQQLIYTSAPRGIVAGRSGYCTVARSAQMREAVMLQLEKWSYYQHLALAGGVNRPIFACRLADIRGARFHVLSRLEDAGLDFTGRTNFIAHHLVFAPEEIRQYPSPPVILGGWSGWQKSWPKEPQLLDKEDWSGLARLASQAFIPARTWDQVTDDAANAYGLLDARAGACFWSDQADEIVLKLLAESLALLEIRDPRRDYRATAWSQTFTTSMQEQDNPADFRWRLIHADNPAAARLASPDCRKLSEVASLKHDTDEAYFARVGKKAPAVSIHPQKVDIVEGESARFKAQASGIPKPALQWYSVDRADNASPLPGETNAELILTQPPCGRSSYIVCATNDLGPAQSEVAVLNVAQKVKLATRRHAETAVAASSASPAKVPAYETKSAEQIDRQRERIAAERAAENYRARQRWQKVLLAVLAVALLATSFAVWKKKNAPVAIAEAAERHPANYSLKGPTALPDGWANPNIGTNAEYLSLHSSYNENHLFLDNCTGRMGSNADVFSFICKRTDSKEFVSDIDEIGLSNAAAVAGIMMRESVSTNSPFFFAGLSAGHICCGWREKTNDPASFTNASEIPLPMRVSISRSNNTFSASFWTDSDNSYLPKTKITHGVSMADPDCWIGFAVCSGTNNATASATFSAFDDK